MVMGSLITYRQTSPVKLKCRLDLRGLYPTQGELRCFRDRLSRFRDSNPYNQKIYELDGDRLQFESEQLIPTKTDHRPRSSDGLRESGLSLNKGGHVLLV